MKYVLYRQHISSPLPECVALLRQGEFPTHGFVNFQEIIPVVDAVNQIALNCEVLEGSLGGKSEELQKCQVKNCRAWQWR